MQRQDLLSFNPSAMESFNSSRGSTVDSVVDEMINHMQPQQQQERKCREWRLVEVQGGRPRSVLQIREWSARLPHRNDEPVLSAPAPLTWHPVWSAPVPSIRVESKFAEDGVLVTEFESHFEDIRKPRRWLCSLYTDLELERENWERKGTGGPRQYSKHRIVTEQQHEPSKNLNLLRAAYFSMNAHVPDSDFTFNVPDWVGGPDDAENDIYDQRSPLGNTVLHLAARYGINGVVEKVAQQSPRLFISRNSNDDTALHVAAREGHESTIRILLKTYFPIATHDENYYDQSDDSNEEYRMDKSVLDMIAMLSLTLFRNSQGNTFLHEALMFNSPEAAATVFKAFEDPFIIVNSQFEDDFKRLFHRLALFALNNEEKSLLYLATEARCKEVVNRLMDICDELDLRPQGKSPLLPPIINRDKDMLENILSKKPKWIHLKDEVGKFPLHYAASVGYLEGVSYLIEKCASCTIERDKDGFFPLHLASGGGHVEVVQELLKWCPDPTEMLDEKNGRNFLHIAAENGKYKVINYSLRDLKLENILRDPKLKRLINQKDKNGDTPLHLATRNWHPKIVHALTWDKRVDLALPNQEHQTALDTALQHADENPSLRQRLTWLALHSVDAQRMSLKVPRKEASNPEKYKDRVDTLILVSTLIITASFAAGLALPGSVEKGKAVMLNNRMFHLFIFCITISMYGAISTTIILIWARLGDLRLALLALKFAKPLLGITLGTLSVAFLAGVYLVVSKLRWLAATFLVMGVVMILMVLLLYILLWLPSSSTSPMIRYISYYPFLLLARLAEAETDDGNNMVQAETDDGNNMVQAETDDGNNKAFTSGSISVSSGT